MSRAANAYRSDIDGLRAIAVLAVLGFHAFPNFVRGGFVGVDVFFVISGFLITQLLRDGLRDPQFRFRSFYARRVRRIFPALTLVLLCTFSVSWFVMLPDEFAQIGKHVAAGASFASNIVLWQESGYFDASADTKPLLHLWSLGIEEQFYAVMPLALLWLTRYTRRPVLAGAVVIASSFALNAWLVGRDATAAFYAPWTRIWELLAGGALAYCSLLRRPGATEHVDAHDDRGQLVQDASSLLGIALIAGAVVGLDRTVWFPGWWALVPVVGSMLLVAAGPTAIVNRLVLSRRPLVWIGLISYPLYLWHWPILKLYLMSVGELLSSTERIALLAASFIAAWLTYALLERPIRRRPAATGTITALCVAMLVVGAAGLLAAFGVILPRSDAHGLDKVLAATYDWRFPTPTLRPFVYDGNRFFQQRSAVDRAVVFIGDSNVEQFAPRISVLLSAHPTAYRSVVFATKGGCLPIPRWNSPTTRCAERLTAAVAYAARPDVDAVVLGGSWINVLGDKDPAATVAPLGPLIRELAASKPVYLVLNIPAGPQFDPRGMFVGSRLTHLAANAHPTALSRSLFLQSYGPLRAELTRIGQDNGAVVIDPLDHLCSGDVCPVMSDDGRPLYTDEHHMRPFHAERDADFIDETLLLQAGITRKR